ncbi:MAG: 50S ribosomal protein L24 [Gammaproteobacteria bacterium]|nr:MAG: 50S ribosomal protein L24 [Gammaproteobacteria bacterium]
MRKIRQGDKVVVLAGRDKGKEGTVLSVSPNNRLLVEGANMVKKHVRPNPNKGITGGIVDQEASLHISNVAVYNPITKKPDRIGFKFLEDGKKVRYFKSNGEIVDI